VVRRAVKCNWENQTEHLQKIPHLPQHSILCQSSPKRPETCQKEHQLTKWWNFFPKLNQCLKCQLVKKLWALHENNSRFGKFGAINCWRNHFQSVP
jgi:hypothetical protein